MLFFFFFLGITIIFHYLLPQAFNGDYSEEIKHLSVELISVQLDFYHYMRRRFLPTPSKLYYVFNLRGKIVEYLNS